MYIWRWAATSWLQDRLPPHGPLSCCDSPTPDGFMRLLPTPRGVPGPGGPVLGVLTTLLLPAALGRCSGAPLPPSSLGVPSPPGPPLPCLPPGPICAASWRARARTLFFLPPPAAAALLLAAFRLAAATSLRVGAH